MSARLTFNGIEISVPVSELGEAIRQLGLSSTPSQPAAKGRTAWPMPPELPVARDQEQKQKQERKPVTDVERWADFLVELDSDPGGSLSTERVMQLLDAAHAKGVGSKTAYLNKQLAELGFAVADVYTNEKDSAGVRKWVAGPKIKEAFQAIVNML